MAAPSAQESSEWDEDPAWSRPDPMTAAELEAGLDRVCEQDEPPERGGVRGLRAAHRGRARRDPRGRRRRAACRGGGRHRAAGARASPAPRGCSPASRPARRPGSGPGCRWTCCPAARAWRSPRTPPRARTAGSPGCRRPSWSGCCARGTGSRPTPPARKLAVSAELARRNPAPPDAEFTADQVAYALGESRGRAGDLIDLAQTLGTRLPGTAAALDDGTITRYKAEIIARATALLDDAGARAAEDKVLDRAARLTPGGLRAAIAHAVMEAAPEKAKERREAAAKDARVERWAEDSGNAALMGCELPPDEVLAADQRITAWAQELRKAGLEGDMDVLRARAFLDLLLGKDSRPRRDASGGADGTGPGPGGPRPGGPGRAATLGRASARRGRVRRAGHPDRPAGHRHRPGRPARRARRDRPGRPVAGPRPGRRGRAQPEDDLVRDRDRRARPRHRARLRPARTQGSPATRRTRTARTGSPSAPASRDGPPGGYGTWRLRTPGDGPDLIITLESLTTDPCDHRHQSQRPRSRGQAQAPGPGPARHLHQPRLPPARRPVRLRAQHPV